MVVLSQDGSQKIRNAEYRDDIVGAGLSRRGRLKAAFSRSQDEIALKSTQSDFHSDLANEVNAATRIVERIPLLTRDSKLLKSKMVPLA